ncbi:hypothetical protein Tco_0049633, partial [Tanacetum coccineum]
QHFELTPHIRSKLWPKIKKGIKQHMAKQEDWDKQIDYWIDPKNATRAAQNAQNQAKSKVFLPAGIPLSSEISKWRAPRPEEMLRMRDLGINTPTGVPYTEEQIMATVRKSKQRGHIPGVDRVLAGQGRDTIFIDEPRGTYTDAEIDEIKEDGKRLRKELELLRRVVRSDDRMSCWIMTIYELIYVRKYFRT